MATPVRGDGGKFHGSVGEGKGRVPTPGTMPRPSSLSGDATVKQPNYDAQHRRLVAAQTGDEGRAAAQVAAAAVAAPTPNTLRPSGKQRSSSRRTPGGWHLSAHVVKQASEKGIDLRDVAECVDDPFTSYPSGRFPGQERRIRGPICVVVDPAAKKAITVYLDRVETDLRQDQRNDRDALEYERRRKGSV